MCPGETLRDEVGTSATIGAGLDPGLVHGAEVAAGVILDVVKAAVPGAAPAIAAAQAIGRLVSTNPKDAIGVTKPPLANVPFSLMLAAAEGFADGAIKYGPFNWRENPVQADIYYEACLRHLASWFDGENIDPKSKVNHLFHAISCLAIIVDGMALGNMIDNRPIRGPAAQIIRDFVHPSKR